MDALVSTVEHKMLHSLVDEARFFIYAYNTTTLVTTAGLALGVFFIVTAIILYIYYYSSTTGRSGGEWEYAGNDYSRYDHVADILSYLEKAFLDYGIEQEDCRKRIMCEAHLRGANLLNKAVSDSLVDAMSQVTEADAATAEEGDAVVVQELIEAARRGLDAQSCQTYEQLCPHQSLAYVGENRR